MRMPPIEGALTVTCCLSSQGLGVLWVSLVVPKEDLLRGTAWELPPHPTDADGKTHGGKDFATVHRREVFGLGVDPDGTDFDIDTIPVLLSEQESEQAEVWTPEGLRTTLLQPGEDGHSAP